MPKTTAQNRATMANLNSDFAGSPHRERRAGPAPTALQPQAKPNATLTEVMLRAMIGPPGGPRPEDPAPARPPEKPITLDYPHISTQPEYAAEADKLNRFAGQLDAARTKLATLYEQIKTKPVATETAEIDRIAKAESLLAGDEAQEDLHAEIRKTNKLIEALTSAIDAQSNVIRRVTWGLAQAAGRRYAEEHKERVRKLMAAVIELHAANQAETDLHHDLLRLGYPGALAAMRLNTVEDPMDKNGNIAHYWFKEAERYVMTDAQVAAGVRKSRLAAALGRD